MRRDPYQILGVPRGANDEEIRSAYRGLARQLHPDASGRADTAEAFREVTEAYDELREQCRCAGEGERVPIHHGPVVAAPAAPAEPLGRGRSRPTPRAPRPEPLHYHHTVPRSGTASRPEPLLRPDPIEPAGRRSRRGGVEAEPLRWPRPADRLGRRGLTDLPLWFWLLGEDDLEY